MYESHHYSHPHHKHRTKLIVVGIFLFILLILLLTSFYGDLGLTGNIIKAPLNPNNSLIISANLESLPPISIDGEYSHVVIRGISESDFYIGDGKFPLNRSESNYIILNDYEGKISFDNEKISSLKGEVSQVSINGISVLPKSKDQVKVSISEHLDYDLLEVPDVYVREINYKTSGTINLGEEKTTLNLHNDPLVLESFEGDLEVKNNRLIINGRIRSLNVQGDQEISVSA